MMKEKMILIMNLLLLIVISGCGIKTQNQLFEDLRILSSDEFEGRQPGTIGSTKAQSYILDRLSEIGAVPFGNSFIDSFELNFINTSSHGKNIQSIKHGGRYAEKLIVVSAHYDHLGIKEDEIYNGANDNATGVSVLLNLVSSLKDTNTNHSFVFLFTDAEEFGKQGVKHFLSKNIDLHSKIVLNFNIDMINCESINELFICGTKDNPKLREILQHKVSDLNIDFGHDEYNGVKKSWLQSSDHREFSNWEIPFLYLGSENEENYNTPLDDFENIDLDCFGQTLSITKELILELDRNLN